MIEDGIPESIYVNLLAPIIAALIFVFILIYFTLVRKQISEVYPFYGVFVFSFIVFLVGRPLQEFSDYWASHFTLYVRMFFLYGIGIPSLLVATSIQSGIKNLKPWIGYSYGVGILIAILYCITVDAASEKYFFTRNILSGLGLTDDSYVVAHTLQFLGALVLLVVPCSALLIRELSSTKNLKLVAYLSGSLMFGIFVLLAVPHPMKLEFIYVGSIFSATCWVWAVFQDIRDMTGKVGMLKDELQMLVQSGHKSITPEVEKLLDGLEKFSEGNLDVYKMRIREILIRLTDVTIQAGGDSQELIQRNLERAKITETSNDPKFIRGIITQEAVELSEIIAAIPEKRTSKLVEDAQRFVSENYHQDLNVDRIVESLNVSSSHFMRLFKKETGQTVNQYLTETRIKNAKLLLASKTVTESAFESGFNDSNYFSTVFKKHTGQTPQEYQKSLQVLE